jgi:2-oxoglutarate ferredoxin oxidoreductase subunit delta
MSGKIVIDTERCKGCGLCITVCPKHGITLATESNSSGYLPAQVKDGVCTGCTRCAIVCPEGIIEVYVDEADRVRVVATTGRKDTSHLVEEQR